MGVRVGPGVPREYTRLCSGRVAWAPMNATVYFETGRLEVFRYEEVPDPVCKPGGVVIDSRFPLAEAAEPHCRIESRLAFGRVLLIP